MSYHIQRSSQFFLDFHDFSFWACLSLIFIKCRLIDKFYVSETRAVNILSVKSLNIENQHQPQQVDFVAYNFVTLNFSKK